MITRLREREETITITLDGSRYLLAWRSRESGQWREILNRLKASLPFHGSDDRLLFDRENKVWTFPSWRCHELAGAARSIFEEPAIHWETAATARPDDLAAAYELLHLSASAPPELVEQVYRWTMKTLHPDRGGSHESAVALNKAIARIREAHTGQRRSA